MNRKKYAAYLAASFGHAPDVDYASGDMSAIAALFALNRKSGVSFAIDDVTAHDLDLDGVFRRVNACRSFAGEQTLYDWLRRPACTQAEWRNRLRLVELMQSREKTRLNLQLILSSLGRDRRAALCELFDPARTEKRIALPAPLMALMGLLPLVALTLAPFLGGAAMIAFLFTLALNGLTHEMIVSRERGEIAAIACAVSLCGALDQIVALRENALDETLADGRTARRPLRRVMRGGGLIGRNNGSLTDILLTVTLADLIAARLIGRRLYRHPREIHAVYDALGRLDAAISVASWRESMAFYACPSVDYGARTAHLEITALVHPLLAAPVPNDIALSGALLVTGSNASGKSTFLKAAALAAILAQSLCTVPAKGARLSAMRVYTSMALSDNLSAGESYYMAEIRALRRIMDALDGEAPLMCAVDELLRGTNTVERIAAASAVLRALAERGALVLAATHDAELCTLLKNRYALGHFEERIENGVMTFDYILRDGPAVSRNALRLLALSGFDPTLIDAASRAADSYLESGRWTEPS